MDKENEIEIDVLDVFRHLKKKIWVIALVTVVSLLCGLLISALVLVPEYTASTRVYVLNRSNENSVVASDFQVSTQMLKDYEVLITGRNVTEEVIRRLNLDMLPEELAEKIQVTAPKDTRFLQISASDRNANMAADIANCVREIASQQITQIMQADAVNLMYVAEVPEEPSSPNIQGNTLLAALLGLVISTGVYVVIYLVDDTIRTEEDVERHLGLSTLGVIPASEKLATGSTGSRRKKKSAGSRTRSGVRKG